ncbi:hypothetical protein AYO38_09040 [bacterium SCGC AG-212-C10]|nr:hypothetical protein AYO38_09040 [bacterium SCGC AG-212-C10]
MVMQEAIRALVEGTPFSGEQAAAAMELIMTGEATPAQIGGFLAALRIRGETPEIVAALAKVMQAHAEPVNAPGCIDICGTGGDGIDTFNVSTAAGFVAAAAGAKVAKHGNRAASSRCGSADVLEALGARIDIGGPEVARVINGCGFGFMFAQRFHPAMKYVGPARRELGIRTVFNMLGPLTNPANPRGQLAGVGSRALAPLMAEAFLLRGMPRAVVVHSADGLDEISPAGSTHAWFVENGEITERELKPSTFGLPTHTLAAVAGGDPVENAAMMRALFDGVQGPIADYVLMNAAVACYVAGIAPDLLAATEMARNAIASGRARSIMERYIILSREVAGE